MLLEGPDDAAEDGAVVPAVLDDHGPAGGSMPLRARPGRSGGPGEGGSQPGPGSGLPGHGLTWPAEPRPHGVSRNWRAAPSPRVSGCRTHGPRTQRSASGPSAHPLWSCGRQRAGEAVAAPGRPPGPPRGSAGVAQPPRAQADSLRLRLGGCDVSEVTQEASRRAGGMQATAWAWSSGW